MAPWIHIYSSPSGEAAPCCIAESCAHGGVGDTRTQSLMEVVNSEKMNQLRRDMLTNTPNNMHPMTWGKYQQVRKCSRQVCRS